MRLPSNEVEMIKLLLQMHAEKSSNPKCILSPNERAIIIEAGFPLKDIIYKVHTKRIKPKGKPKVIKDIHYSNLNREWIIYRRYSPQQLEILKQYGFEPKPHKSEILLNEYKAEK